MTEIYSERNRQHLVTAVVKGSENNIAMFDTENKGVAGYLWNSACAGAMSHGTGHT